MRLAFDTAKDVANLRKHGLSLADAAHVYEAPAKRRFVSRRGGESRMIDIAFVEAIGAVLVLVYVERDDIVRAISLRRASRKERSHYAAAQEI